MTRLEEAGAVVAQAAGQTVALGQPLPPAARTAIGQKLADILVGLLQEGAAQDPLSHRLLLTEPLGVALGEIDQIAFSGGVAEYVYGRSREDFGDLGPALGAALAAFARTLPPGTLREPAQGIRATVIGAGEYTIQVSGLTSFSSGTDRLPLFGLQVVQARHAAGEPFARTLADALTRLDLAAIEPGLMISTDIAGPISYPILRDIADGIAAAIDDPAVTVVINVMQDVARALGRILADELKLPNPLIVIDGVSVGDLDYVDIGRPLGAAAVFPVTVKSLLFSPGQVP